MPRLAPDLESEHRNRDKIKEGSPVQKYLSHAIPHCPLSDSSHIFEYPASTVQTTYILLLMSAAMLSVIVLRSSVLWHGRGGFPAFAAGPFGEKTSFPGEGLHPSRGPNVLAHVVLVRLPSFRFVRNESLEDEREQQVAGTTRT